jgi:hypothetical protein
VAGSGIAFLSSVFRARRMEGVLSRWWKRKVRFQAVVSVPPHMVTSASPAKRRAAFSGGGSLLVSRSWKMVLWSEE